MADKIYVENLERNNKINVCSNKDSKKSIFSKLLNFFSAFSKENKNGVHVDKLENAENNQANSKKENNITKFFKIKQVKTAVIVLIFSVVALLILSSSFSAEGSKTKEYSSYMTSLEYCEKLEHKLMDVLGGISGVGNIKVMVTVESSPEIKIATSTDERTNTTTNGTNLTTNTTVVSDPVIVTGSGEKNPLILSEKTPQITGVIVVAEGAKDVKVRLNLLEAVEALLNVSTNNIQIYYWLEG